MKLAAILKRLAAAVTGSKKGKKVMLGILLGILFICLLPFIVIQAMFAQLTQGDLELPQYESSYDETFQNMHQNMALIAEAMDEHGVRGKTLEAQFLYIAFLFSHGQEDGFPERLASCFAAEQTTQELILAVNQEFSAEILEDVYVDGMASTRRTSVNIYCLDIPESKNAADLAAWAQYLAEASGWGVVSGMSGEILTSEIYESMDPESISAAGVTVIVGARNVDAGGLLRSYLWLDPETEEILIPNEPIQNAETFYQQAEEKGERDSMPDIPGVCLYKSGTMGIYIGNGNVVTAIPGSGLVIENVGNGWTHWFFSEGITYPDIEEEEETESQSE